MYTRMPFYFHKEKPWKCPKFCERIDRQLNEAQNNTREINKNGGHEQHGISKEEVERLNMLVESEDELLSVSERCLVAKWRMQSGTYVLNDIHDQGRTKLLSDLVAGIGYFISIRYRLCSD